MEPIRSETYTIGRLELAYATTAAYVRTFWWALVGVPISGVLIIAILSVPIMQYLGAVMVLWPITIPGRALLITDSHRRLYLRPTVCTLREDGVYLDPEGATPTRVPREWIHGVRRWRDVYLLFGAGTRLVVVKASAFAPSDQVEVDHWFRGLGEHA